MISATDNWLIRERSARFAASCTIVSIAVLLTGLTAYVNFFDLHFLAPDYPKWKYQKEFLATAPAEHNDLVVLGDSRALAAYDPLATRDVASRNLALPGASIIEAYYTLEKYLENHSTDSVVLSFAPFHLAEIDVFWGRSVKLHYLTPAEVMESIALDKATGKVAVISKSFPLWRYYLDYLPFAYRAELRQAAFQGRFQANDASFRHTRKHKGQHFFGERESEARVSVDAKYDAVEPLQLVDDYLVRLARLARDRNIKVYWYTAPLNDSTCAAVNQNYLSSYSNYLADLEQRLGIIVLSNIFCLEANNFGDIGHVNQRGADHVTRDLVWRWQNINK